MWALVVDGTVELVRDELPTEVMGDPVTGVAPVMVAYSEADAAADGWVQVALSTDPGDGSVPLLVVDGGTVTQTWVED